MSNTEMLNYENFYNIAENLSRNGSDIKKYCVICFKNECDVRLVGGESYYNILKLLSLTPIVTLSQQALVCKICNYLLEKVTTFLEDLRTTKMVNDLVNSNPRLCMNVLESLATKTEVHKYSRLVVERIDKLNSQLNSLLARKLPTTKLLYPTTESEIWDTFETEDKKEKAMKSKRHDVEVKEKFPVYGAHPNTEVTNDARSNLKNETDEEICVKPINNINHIKIYSDLLKEEFVKNVCNSNENFDDIKKECDGTKKVGDVKTEVDDDEDIQKDDIIDLDSIKESNDEFIDNERMIKEIVTKQPVVVLNKLLENDLESKAKVKVPKSPPKQQIFMVRNSQLVPFYILGDLKDEVLNQIWNDDQIVQHVDQNNKNVNQTLPTIEQTGINVSHYKTKDKNTVNVGKVQNLAMNVVKTVHNSQTVKSKGKSINLVKRSNSNDCVEISGNMDTTVNQEMENIEKIPPISLVRDPKTSYKIRETPKVQSEVNNKRKFSDHNKNSVSVIKVRKAIMDSNKVVEGITVVTEDDSLTYILPDVLEKKEDSTDFVEIVDDTNLSKTDGDVIVCDSDSDS